MRTRILEFSRKYPLNDRMKRVLFVNSWVIPSILAVLAYINTLGNLFTLDDFNHVLQNPYVTGPVALHLWTPTPTIATDFFRPLATFFFSIDHALFGIEAWGYHLSSLLWHLATTCMVAIWCRRLVGVWVGLVAGSLFAVHPIHVEAVAAVANRPEVLATFFTVAALLLATSKKWSPVRIALLFLVSCAAPLSKESGVFVPVLVGAMALQRHGWRPALVRAGVSLSAVGAYLALRWHALADARSAFGGSFIGDASWGEAIMTVASFVTGYARLFLAPLNLRADYSTLPIVSTPNPSAFLGLVILVTAFVALLVGLRRGSAWWVGVVILTVPSLLYLHLLDLSVSMAERFMYLPSVGFCLLAALAATQLVKALPRPMYGAILLVALVTAFLALTATRNLDWETPLSLWEREVAIDGDNAFARGNLALSLWTIGERDAAIEELQAAVDLEPHVWRYRAELVRMHLAVGDIPGAEQVLAGGSEYTGSNEFEALAAEVAERRRTLEIEE